MAGTEDSFREDIEREVAEDLAVAEAFSIQMRRQDAMKMMHAIYMEALRKLGIEVDEKKLLNSVIAVSLEFQRDRSVQNQADSQRTQDDVYLERLIAEVDAEEG